MQHFGSILAVVVLRVCFLCRSRTPRGECRDTGRSIENGNKGGVGARGIRSFRDAFKGLMGICLMASCIREMCGGVYVLGWVVSFIHIWPIDLRIVQIMNMFYNCVIIFRLIILNVFLKISTSDISLWINTQGNSF